MRYRVTPGTPYVVDDATGMLYTLSTRPLEVQVLAQSGGLIWGAVLRSEDPTDAMVAQFSEADPTDVRTRTAEFVRELLARGLIEEVDERE